MAKNNSRWYVTYWREYPIYEPAEGGYYYAGSQNLWTRSFNTFRKAKRCFAKSAAEFRMYFEIDGEAKRISESYICKGGNIIYHAKHIGDGEGISITFGAPERERGYTPYC